jgi:hypothetical protein
MRRPPVLRHRGVEAVHLLWPLQNSYIFICQFGIHNLVISSCEQSALSECSDSASLEKVLATLVK